jgi:signal transduction histidine kinase
LRQTFDTHLLSYQRFHNLPVIYRYLYPTLMIILGIGLHLAFSEVVGSSRFLFIYPLVFLCAWFFGSGPGLYALIVASLLVTIFFIPHPPEHYLGHNDFFTLLSFVFNLGFIIWIMSRGTRDAKLLVENQKNLSEALFYRDEFLSIASHELKTPLTSLKLQSQMFKRGVLKNDPGVYSKDKIDRIIDQTDRQVTRLTRLVDDMLDISRIRTGKLSIMPEKLNICQLVGDLLERMRPQLLESLGEAPVLHDCDETLISCDKVRIEQVISNLISNALKYGEHKPISVQIEKDAHEVRILVIDHGMGIAPENHTNIFNRFQRAVPASEVSGLGLGLYISRLIVEAHQGSLTVKSQLGQGSTFIVALPVLGLK